MGGHPGVKGMLGIRVLGTDRFETGKVLRIELLEQGGAATPSSSPAPVINKATTTPRGSTTRCRLRPFTCLPPSSPRSAPPLSVVVTDGRSMHAALGVGARPACRRVCSRQA